MTFVEKIKYEFNKGNSAVRQIIMLNLAAFVFSILIGVIATVSGFSSDDLLQYFYLPSNLSHLVIRPWTIVTNIFFHHGFWHIFVNMLLLFFLGRILEDFLSNKQMWQLFLFGGILGGIVYVATVNLSPALAQQIGFLPLLGASGGVTAIIVATGLHIPYYNVRPFGLFNVELRWVALFFVFRDLYYFPVSNNAGGLLAHMGGAILGALFILNLQGRLNLPTINFIQKSKIDEVKLNKKRSSVKTKPNQHEIDAILDKISQSGYNSLTKEEKDILFKASE
ncbi:MAG: rhomboid family intramembrane serine protease [Bacteroidia bacterium]|nr:rhomboid family intramembrane serine protease [Bacteroidia bacterium]NNJ54498.1 rhomboid family intramembrane serine protease [Bacteroidia bacterium]